MITIHNIFDKYRSVTIERVHNFLSRKGIEHQCSELKKIDFKLEGWSWDLYIEDNYVNICLDFIKKETDADKKTNRKVAKESCLEVTKRIKVIKAFYTSHSHNDEANGNRLTRYDIFHFSFESFCYNMYEFNELFYNGLRLILGGYSEYRELYDELESKSPVTPVGFIQSDCDNAKEKLQPTDKHHIGFA